MPQEMQLTEADLTVLDGVLRRMVKRSWGVLTTLPLFCLGIIEAGGLRELILDHYDAWHSYLVVARETLRAAQMADGTEMAAVRELLEISDSLRDAYLQLAECRTHPGPHVKVAYDSLRDAYARIPHCIKQIGSSLDLKVTSIIEPQRAAVVCSERSLNWFGDELKKFM